MGGHVGVPPAVPPGRARAGCALLIHSLYRRIAGGEKEAA